jgi:hypothetical protein
MNIKSNSSNFNPYPGHIGRGLCAGAPPLGKRQVWAIPFHAQRLKSRELNQFYGLNRWP